MKNKTIQFFASLLFLSLAMNANALVIVDTYEGSDDHGYGDRIGDSRYEIDNMEVIFSGGYMNIRVNTNFNQTDDPYGIQFGDLFISSDGWNPYGSAPYTADDASTGEAWEFVFDTSANMLYGGDFSINLSDDMVDPAYIFRNGQEVQRNAGGTSINGSSVDTSHAGEGGYIEYNILLSSLGPISGDVGLKWGMTCANDTIEGALAIPVPEPGSLVLLSLGLFGLAGLRKKKT